MPGPSLIDSVKRDAERSLFRARNGIRYVAGVGRPQVGLSPKEVIWRRGKAQLWRYDSDRRTRRPPLVIVFSILGRSYVVDLRPDNSFVQRLLGAGSDVFLVDFGVPDQIDAGNTLETYVDNYLPRALRAAAKRAGEPVDVLAYCFGGVMTALTLAAHPDLPVRRLMLMATPIDFAGAQGVLGLFARGRLSVEELLDDTGNVPPEAVYRMFRGFKPTSDILMYAMLWERLWNDEFMDGFQAMSQWVRDQVPFPGACAAQCVELLLQRNALVRGEVPLGGRVVKLKDLTQPTLVITAKHDHIVPPAMATPIMDLIGSDSVEELRVPAGHVGLVTSRESARTTEPGILEWLDRPIP
jgi:polyhydroxyalkanoate synthase